MSAEQCPESLAQDARPTQERTQCRRTALLPVAMVCLAALLGSVRPSYPANVQYGEHYEQAYLAACMATDTAQACSCMMEAIETEISFGVFADLVELHDGQIGRDTQQASVVEAARSRCIR